MAIFPNFFFFYYIGQKNAFYNILKRKNAFLGYKNKRFKKAKKWHFSKAVNPWFWSKNWPFFLLLFLGNVGQENLFYDILEQKKSFLAYKNNKFKKSKNWYFSKGFNPWFWSKYGHCPNFFFIKYRPGKRLFWYSRTKTRFCRLYKQEV